MMEGSYQRFNDFLYEYYLALKVNIRPDQTDKDMMIKFVEYLQSRSMGEGARGYFQRLKKIVKYTAEKDIFLTNPRNRVVCVVDDSALTKDMLTLG
ncbi:hypothetical protein DCPSUM001_34060 [Dysgonomonas capnocytophagoides]|nr:hypothetical protein DCPSUM001_34060 [Dysgonomonas capnocytophagoides]